MRFTTIVAFGLAAVGVLAGHERPELKGFPFGYDHAFAEEPVRVRKEWRQLTIPERKEFIRAVKCLHEIPGIYRDIVPSSFTLYEDFAAEHKIQTPYIHWESQFLPWHRYFVWTFENALRQQCGYRGAHPYWDYSLDSNPKLLHKSPIFDPEHGFGGDGFPINPPEYPFMPQGMPTGSGGGCLMNGPFKNWTINIAGQFHLGPPEPRCLTRNINVRVGSKWCNRAVEEVIVRQTTYQDVYENFQGTLGYKTYAGMHFCGHFIVAGPKAGADVYIGPIDPLFFMHHANVDRIWWEWQSRDLERRVNDMTGPVRPRTDIFKGSNYTGFPQKNITMDWELDVGRLAPKVKTEEVMHIQRGILNYRYTNPREKYIDGVPVPWPFEEHSEEQTQEFEKQVESYEQMWAKFKNATWAPGAGGKFGGIV